MAQEPHYSPASPDGGYRRPGSVDAPNISFPPPPPPPSDPNKSNPSRGVSSARSEDLRHPQPMQSRPINDVVASAFDKSDAAGKFDPAMIAHITEQVISNLKLSGYNGQAGSSVSNPSAPPGYLPPHSPSSNASFPPRNVYTPESPVRLDETNSVTSDGYNEQMDGNSSRTAKQRQNSPSPPPTAKPLRPEPAARTFTGDATTLEKIWRQLFDADARPTERLGQFLRGLALTLIEDYEPKDSLVISPKKMLQFYNDHRLAAEIYPWDVIFGGKMKESSLSHLYRDLRCQHHFVQVQSQDKPTVPALTPDGFECWMTNMIRSHPDAEFERLGMALTGLPISNADDRKERLPKELSRRLFPAHANAKIQAHLVDCMTADSVVVLSRHPSFSLPSQPAPQSAYQQSSLQPPSHAAGLQTSQSVPPPATSGSSNSMPPPVDRNVYSNPSSTVGTDDDSHHPSISIERERKPYSAQPGGGKVYDAPGGGRLYDEDIGSQRADVRGSRANTVSAARPNLDAQDEYTGGTLRHVRTTSSAAEAAAPPRGWRQYSPSRNAGNPYTRSETDVFPSSYGSQPSSLHLDDEEVGRKASRDERTRRYADDDQFRGYPIPQSQPGRGQPIYEDEHHRRGTTAGVYNPSNFGQYPPPHGPHRY